MKAQTEVDPILAKLNAAVASAHTAVPTIRKPADLIPFCQVPDASGLGLIPMQPFPHVLGLLEFWEHNQATLTNKSRQMQATWSYALRALYLVGWKSYQTICSANYTKEQACELIWRMKILWSTLPRAWRPNIVFCTDYCICPDTSSRVIVVATNDLGGAGDTITELFIDEAGLIKDLQTNWPALSQAAQAGKKHLCSTPRAAGQFFATAVAKAKANEGPFKYRFLHYSEHPDRKPGTPKGDAWLAARKDELSEEDFQREYEGQFVRPGNCYFGRKTIDALELATRGKVPLKTLFDGALHIWEPPRPGESYSLGADVAEGLDDGDASAAAVLHKLSGRVVATYRARVPVGGFAEHLNFIGRQYNNCWMAIEANNHGHAVCLWLFQALKYRRILREDRSNEGRVAGGVAPRLGILTTEASKPAMLSILENGLRTGTIQVPDPALVAELACFLHLGGGRYGAAPGEHDDRVIALALAQYARGRKVPTSW